MFQGANYRRKGRVIFFRTKSQIISQCFRLLSMNSLYYYVLYVYLLDNSNTVFSFYAKYQPTHFPLGLQRIILLNALLTINNDPGIFYPCLSLERSSARFLCVRHILGACMYRTCSTRSTYRAAGEEPSSKY